MRIEDFVGKELPQLNVEIKLEADAFYEIGMEAFDVLENALKTNGEIVEKMYFAPAIVNTALASELYLKSLLPKNEKGHLLTDLFKKQDKNIRDIIIFIITDTSDVKTQSDFEDCLEKIKNAFVDFRYFYEDKMNGIPFNIQFLKLFATALKNLGELYKH